MTLSGHDSSMKIREAAPRALGRPGPSQERPEADGTALKADAWQGQPQPVRIITFNTAVGNSRIKTPQAAFPDLPFYREALAGKADAAILCLQEVGPDQVDRLKELDTAGRLHLSFDRLRPWQGNLVVIPERYEVLSDKFRTFKGSHVRGVLASLWATVKDGYKPNALQWVEPRGYNELRLRDRQSGRTLTVINTHLSLDPEMRKRQAEDLAKIVRRAKAHGPVVLAGDLNTHPADQATGGRQGDADAAIRSRLLENMVDAGPAAPPGRRKNIDWVLVDGLKPSGSRYYLGKDLSLPGSPDAERVSDHYAEDNLLAWPDLSGA